MTVGWQHLLIVPHSGRGATRLAEEPAPVGVVPGSSSARTRAQRAGRAPRCGGGCRRSRAGTARTTGTCHHESWRASASTPAPRNCGRSYWPARVDSARPRQPVGSRSRPRPPRVRSPAGGLAADGAGDRRADQPGGGDAATPQRGSDDRRLAGAPAPAPARDVLAAAGPGDPTSSCARTPSLVATSLRRCSACRARRSRSTAARRTSSPSPLPPRWTGSAGRWAAAGSYRQTNPLRPDDALPAWLTADQRLTVSRRSAPSCRCSTPTTRSTRSSPALARWTAPPSWRWGPKRCPTPRARPTYGSSRACRSRSCSSAAICSSTMAGSTGYGRRCGSASRW